MPAIASVPVVVLALILAGSPTQSLDTSAGPAPVTTSLVTEGLVPPQPPPPARNFFALDPFGGVSLIWEFEIGR